MSDVYFISARPKNWDYDYSLPGKLRELLKRMDISGLCNDNKYVALKTHLGSEGAFRIIRPYFLKIIADQVKELKGIPFITDTRRIKTLEYLNVAMGNGISHGTVGAPVIMADGLYGKDAVIVKSGPLLERIAIASAIYDVPSMIVVTHCKAHIQSGYAGAIKNLSMGCTCSDERTEGKKVSRGRLHAVDERSMVWEESLCDLCEQCVHICPTNSIHNIDGKIVRDESCWLCLRCTRVCPTGALKGTMSQKEFQLGLAEAAKSVLETFEKNRVFYLNFLIEIQPECDCMPACDVPFVQDYGVFASYDIVAVEQASYDYINKGFPLPGSYADEKGLKHGDELIPGMHDETTPQLAIDKMEEYGLGSKNYNIIEIERYLREK